MATKAVICEVAGKGLGMIALEPLHPGQVLLKEKPVIEVDMGAGQLGQEGGGYLLQRTRLGTGGGEKRVQETC